MTERLGPTAETILRKILNDPNTRVRENGGGIMVDTYTVKLLPSELAYVRELCPGIEPLIGGRDK